MPTNKYFNTPEGYGTKSEQDLVESLVIELIQLSGSNLYYIPRTQNAPDSILNEDPVSSFEKSYEIEMYLANPVDWGGAAANIVGQAGFELLNQTNWVISKKRFSEEAGDEFPKEGDLIYWPMTKTLWQIDLVDDSVDVFFSLNKIFTWNCKCSLFIYSYEKFRTGINKVDTSLDQNTFKDKFGKNDDINQQAKDILDASEGNPFGDPTE